MEEPVKKKHYSFDFQKLKLFPIHIVPLFIHSIGFTAHIVKVAK